MSKVKTVKDVERIVKELDPALDPQRDDFKSAVLLLSALVVGPTVPALCAFTGFPRAFVVQRAFRLRRSGVFTRRGEPQGKMKIAADWNDPETGGIAFWLDVAVAEGMVSRG